MLTDVESAWLAGLLEGEGYFCINPPSSTNLRKSVILRVGVEMSDRDIVEKCASIMPGSPRHVRTRKPVNSKWSDTYVCEWYSQRAEEVMLTVLPYMGERRSRKIREGLASPALSHRKVPHQFVEPPPAVHGVSWLAGLLEGEGCFYLKTSKTGRRPVLSVALKMSDRDVVARASSLLPGSPRAVHRNASPSRNPKWSPMHTCTWHGQEAEDLMVAVLPYMGQRRSAKIRECLSTPTLSHTESTPTERE